MSVLTCKMCGGTLEVNNKETVAVCEYCGTKQTLPRLDDERRANLYDRANHFRRNNEFDKAMGIYEQILNEDNTDAEVYWSLVLCRYGIEYVEEPSTNKRIPTVNRAQFTSIYDDDNYRLALQYADSYQRNIYEEEAKVINEIQKGILEISQKEEPFDVFICYKESDNNGKRTSDSVLANDLYHQLTQEGFKVFFARITLEDKLGTAYEPYIFAALNSAKVMVVLGTKPEYFSAVWVKNEWSRYLALIKNGAKKMLIPAYKDMDPYGLPEEFSHLQAQDMSKLGFMQDLIRGIKKIVNSVEIKQTVVEQHAIKEEKLNAETLLKRAFIFLEDGKFSDADDYFEKVLDIAPENAEAYVGKLMVELGVRKRGHLADCEQPFDGNSYYQKVLRFGNDGLVTSMKGYIEHINIRNENARRESIYNKALDIMRFGNTERAYTEAANMLSSISGYKDADAKIGECQTIIEEKKAQAETKRLEWKRRAEIIGKQVIHYKKIALITVSAICAVIVLALALDSVIIPNIQYSNAISLMEKGEYEKAINAFEDLDGYKDSYAKIDECDTAILDREYDAAVALMEEGKYAEAISAFEELYGYKDSDEKISECNAVVTENEYNEAVALVKEGKYAEAISAFQALGEYKDSAEKIVWLSKREKIRDANVGDYITFGSYEQDNRSTNGKEEIEWLVLAKEDNKILVLSKYALEGMPFNISLADMTWENCSLRKWLNDTFINNAFSEEEQALIPTVTVSADKNPSYDTNPGNATQDKIFLLSINEVNKYFYSNSGRECKPTNYIVGKRVGLNAGNVTWWLRTSGENQRSVSVIMGHDGAVDEFGFNVNVEGFAVRPALWIALE